jgi:protein O-GlcNAc transferase
LWAGLPVVTCAGANFAGRVAASLLNAVRMPELVTGSLADYEALALKLARDRALMAALKTKLVSNRGTCPLFDTAGFTRHLESAFKIMWEHNQRGEKPTSFAVEAGARSPSPS